MKGLQDNYKGHMDNNKRGGWKQGRELGKAGMVVRGGGEWQKTVLDQQ